MMTTKCPYCKLVYTGNHDIDNCSEASTSVDKAIYRKQCECMTERKYDEYWKSTSSKRNIAINEIIFLLRNEGIANNDAHKIALKIENIWIEVFENE